MKTVFLAAAAWLFISSAGFGSSDKSDYIYFERDDYRCRFKSPPGWRFDLEDARADGYSAALLPDTAEYYNSGMIIYIWIFKRGSINYAEFITADSSAYLKRHPGLKFTKTDSVKTDRGNFAVYLETSDPGGEQETAFVGYIDSEKEVIVYQMDITSRFYYSEALSHFREALKGFTMEFKGEDDSEP
jgi:hypothetical protein